MPKKGLLDRKVNGAVPAKDTFNENEFKKNEIPAEVNKPKKVSNGNQKVSIKINRDIKNDIDTIKMMQKIKFDYETLQLLVDTYKNSLSTEDRRRYNSLKDTIS